MQKAFTIFQHQMIGDSTERVLIGTLSLDDMHTLRYVNQTPVWPGMYTHEERERGRGREGERDI